MKADQREIETSRGKNDGVGTGHRIVVFFCVSCFAGKWKGKSAARGMDLIDKKGTTVPNNRLSRCKRSPLQAPGVWGWNPHNRHLSG